MVMVAPLMAWYWLQEPKVRKRSGLAVVMDQGSLPEPGTLMVWLVLMGPGEEMPDPQNWVVGFLTMTKQRAGLWP